MSNEIKGFDPEYDDNKPENKILSGRVKVDSDGNKMRKVQLLHASDMHTSEKAFEGGISKTYTIKNDIELYTSDKGQQKIHCWLIEHDDGTRKTNGIRLSRRTKKGLYGDQEITLSADAIVNLREFLNTVFSLSTEEVKKLKTLISPIQSELISIDEIKTAIEKNVNSMQDVYDWLNITKKREALVQLKFFMAGNFKHETEVTNFLSRNTWILGSQYIYASSITKINEHNILDIAPQNIGSYIDIVEVKRPEVLLFRKDNSHDIYYPSAELTKAIAQTQNYIHKFETDFSTKYRVDGTQVVRPFATIIIGNATSLSSEEKDAQRILNASYHNIRILTYQELLENAENSIKSTF
jgi:hypothetical protein